MFKLLIALLFTIVAVNAACLDANAAFNVYGISGISGSASFSYAPGSICNRAGSTISSCCPNATLAQIQQYWNQFQQNVSSNLNNYRASTVGVNVSAQFRAQLAGASIDLSTFTSAQTNALNNFTSAVQTFYQNAANNFQSCWNGIRRYYGGLLCLMCSPNASDYVNIQGSSSTGYQVTFTLDNDTCEFVGETCAVVYQNFNRVSIGYSLFINSFFNASSSGNITTCPNLGMVPHSDGTCTWACDSFVAGLAVPTVAAQFNASAYVVSPVTALTSALSAAGGAVTSSLTAAGNAVSSAATSVTTSVTASASASATAGTNRATQPPKLHVMEARDTIIDFATVLARKANMFPALDDFFQVRQAGTTQTAHDGSSLSQSNTYEGDGYEASSQGQNSNLNGTNSGSGSGSSSAVAVLPTVAVLLLALFFLF